MSKEDWILLAGVAIGAYFLYQITQSAKGAAASAATAADSAACGASSAAAALCAVQNPLSTIGHEIEGWFTGN